MSPSPAGVSSIERAIQLRKRTDARTSHWWTVVLPVVLFLFSAGAVTAATVYYPIQGALNAATLTTWVTSNTTVMGLVGGAAAAFLISLLLGIVAIYLLTQRLNEHQARDRVLRRGILELCREQASLAEDPEEHLEAMEHAHDEALLQERERPAGLHILLGLFTLGIWFLRVLHYLLGDPPAHARRQAVFTEHANKILRQAELIEEPLPIPEPLESRSFGAFLALFLIGPALVVAAVNLLALPAAATFLADIIQAGLLGVWGTWAVMDLTTHFDRQWAYEDELNELIAEVERPKPTRPKPSAKPEPDEYETGSDAEDAPEPSGLPTRTGPTHAPRAGEDEEPASGEDQEEQPGTGEPGAEPQDEEAAPAFTVWACGECGQRYKVPPKRPVRVTCKSCGNQEILEE